LAKKPSQAREIEKAEGERGRGGSTPLLRIVLLDIAEPSPVTFAHRLGFAAMTERPQMLKIGPHPFGDKACAFDLIGLPSLELHFQTYNSKVEEGIGQARLLLAFNTNGLLHDCLRLMTAIPIMTPI
jgi:hypothetical protein